MTFGSRLRAVRKTRGLTQKKLAELLGAKHNSVSNWENDQNEPGTKMMEAICRVLDTSTDYLVLGREKDRAVGMPSVIDFDESEISLVHSYRRLNARARGAVDALIGYYNAVQPAGAGHPGRDPAPSHSPPKDMFEVITGRISNQGVAAGYGTWLEQDDFAEIKVIKNNMTRRAAFYVPVEGNSMEPRFRDGDILIVEQGIVRPGEIGVFTLDNQGYVKQCGRGELISLNSAYAPIPMTDEIICNGRVVGILDPEWIVE